ncbi:hypothetical protein A5641_10415 [Mycobacterium sp. 1554424.7]|nr:hypothetical protein A5641_10415 [Mycobacterium sp. 1554424.7]
MLAKENGWPSRIILAALTTLLGMQQLAGASIPFGGSAWKGSPTNPFQGDCFESGSRDFTDVADLLRMAVPQSWQGAAADAYTTANSALITQAQTMTDLDREMEKLVKDHAECVSQTQLGIGIEQDVLIAVYPMIVFLESNYYTFFKARTAAIAVSAAAVGAAVALLSWCLGTSIQTQQAVNRLAYGDVLAAVLAAIEAYASAPAPQSNASVASDGAYDSSTVSVSSRTAGTPTAASSPGSTSGSGPQRTSLDASTGEGQRLSVHSPEVAATPHRGAALTPGSPMPSVAQPGQRSGQAANLAGSLTSPSNSSNPPGEPAVPEQAVRAGESEDTEAASGTQRNERAPIDVTAAGLEQTPAPAPADAL